MGLIYERRIRSILNVETETRRAPDTRTPEIESSLHDRYGCVGVSTRGNVITTATRKGAGRMDADWILVEDANGFRTEIIDDGTKMLLGGMGGYEVTTLHRRAEVHDTY